MIFWEDQEYTELPDSSSQSWKIERSQSRIRAPTGSNHSYFEARFETKNAYVDEVIQQAVKKKIVPAIERRIRTVDGGGRRRDHSIVLW